MIRDRKGDIGFMEAMVGAMTVCVVLMAFSAFLAHDILNDEKESPEFDWNIIKEVKCEDGEYGLAYFSDPLNLIDKYELNGIGLKIYDADNQESARFSELFGNQSDNNLLERKLFKIDGGDNISHVVILEVSLFT